MGAPSNEERTARVQACRFPFFGQNRPCGQPRGGLGRARRERGKRRRTETGRAGGKAKNRRGGVRRRGGGAFFTVGYPEIVIFATNSGFCTDFYVRARIYKRRAV